MATARLVRNAIEKSGWQLVSIEGSHRKYRKGNRTEMFAYHDSVDLGRRAMARIAKQYGMSTEELRRLL
jgi:predicted RNA binding protein YcfA (HicA-like mRNA interferase family)